MKVLLDECVPKALGRQLRGHYFSTVAKCGWAGITNGELLRRAQVEFDVFVTVDQNMTFQLNLDGLSIAVIVIQAVSNALEDIVPFVPRLLEVLERPLSSGAIIIERQC